MHIKKIILQFPSNELCNILSQNDRIQICLVNFEFRKGIYFLVLRSSAKAATQSPNEYKLRLMEINS